MMQIEVGAAGFLFGLLLWSIAVRAARARELRIGRTPYGWLACASVLAVLIPREQSPTGIGLIVCTSTGVLVCALTDARTGYIFDPVVITFAVAVLLLATASGGLVMALSGALATGALLGALYALTRGRGIGLGDVKLSTVLGLGLMLPYGAIAIGAAFVFGGGYGAWLLAHGAASRSGSIRFGPFIAAGAAFAISLRATGFSW